MSFAEVEAIHELHKPRIRQFLSSAILELPLPGFANASDYMNTSKGEYMRNKTMAISFLTLIFILSTTGFINFQSLKETPDSGRRYINLPNRTVLAPYNDAVLVGNTLYISGRIGLDLKTGKPPLDRANEIRFMLDGVKATLAEAGMTMDDLVSVQVFCPDLSLYDKFNTVYKSYFTQDFPARAFIGSGPLLREGHFEIQGIAVKR